MKALSITIYLLLSASAIAGMPERAPLSDADPFRESIKATNDIAIFEGLPHQMFEGDLMEREAKRADVIRIANYPFYTPPIGPNENATLKKILGGDFFLVKI